VLQRLRHLPEGAASHRAQTQADAARSADNREIFDGIRRPLQVTKFTGERPYS
jgi:hypothetical protein